MAGYRKKIKFSIVMVHINLFRYGETTSVEDKLIKFANDNLASFLEYIIDLVDDGFSLKTFFPWYMLERKPDECKRIMNDMLEILKSNQVREYLKPKYEFFLYSVILTWEDFNEDEGVCLPIQHIESSLRESYLSQFENDTEEMESAYYILDALTSVERYRDFCFVDYDFMIHDVELMTLMYIKKPWLFYFCYSDIYIDDYEDLMPNDIREQFISIKELRKNRDELIETSQEEYEIQLVSVFLEVIRLLEQRIVHVSKRSEVEISDDIYTATKTLLRRNYDIIVEREATIGRAKKALGETDLYLYRDDKGKFSDIAIIENKDIEGFVNQYRQLLGYLNCNFKFGMTISINRNKKPIAAKKYIMKKLDTFRINRDDFSIVNIDEPIRGNSYVIRSKHKVPEDDNVSMNIYHLILNLYDREREEIALKARK